MLMRRTLLLGGAGAVLVAAGVGYRLVYPTYAGAEMDAPTAFHRSEAGELLLIDIRRPDEWAATGSAKGAHRLDLRRSDFFEALSGLANGAKGRPIALICAKGVRSARLANQLTDQGFTNIINVTEGMLGSAAGPGWVARGLPVVMD